MPQVKRIQTTNGMASVFIGSESDMKFVVYQQIKRFRRMQAVFAQS